MDFIYFDLGNVILNFDHEKGCQQVAKLAGISSSNVRTAIFDDGLDLLYETGQINCDDFHLRFCESAQCRIDKADFLNAASDIFTSNNAIFPLLKQLESAKTRIGLLSNTCRAHWEFICSKYPTLPGRFDPVILSFEVRSMKPARKIYETAITMAGLPADRCFFIDDRIENVEGAVACGMDAVQYRTVPELISEMSVRGFRID